jgi:RHS repeat-associated protein
LKNTHRRTGACVVKLTGQKRNKRDIHVHVNVHASFDAANRMRSITFTGTGTGTGAGTDANAGSSDTSCSLSYDQNGNLTQKQNQLDPNDKTTYAWDANNRLIQMNQSKTINSNTGTGSAGTTGTSTSTSSTVLSASFSYDAFGRRIQSTITQGSQAPNTVQYLYEGAQALGEIRDGKLSHRLLTGLSLDETIARIAINADGNKVAANSRLYLTDALNSVIAQLADDDNANIQNSYAYSPYGQSQTVGPDSANNPNQYTSRENDNTGLYYYRARYYDPVLKMFVSSDPIGLAGGMNTFAYVDGNPLSMVDPDGLAGAIPKNYGKGKPIGPALPGEVKKNTERNQEAGQNVGDTLKCLFTFRNCELEMEIKKMRRCLVARCTSTCPPSTFTIDYRFGQSAFDPSTTACECQIWGLDPAYVGGAPPGLTAPGR